ncbi:MAG: YebC/PmpR family DNA-binding transcriptional regulator [Armatimonadota bacterium]
MSGHSKWHNIRLRKGKQDAERGKTFTKVSREIIVAVKQGGPNPDANPRLRLALQKAKEVSMPAETVRRAIQRGTGEGEVANYEEVSYEGYGPGGVAVLVECLTDNRNRTVSEVRHCFTRNGGTLGESGCVAWVFEPKGLISIPAESADEDTVLAVALEAGAEDVRTDQDGYEVITAPEDIQQVRKAFEDAGIAFTSAQVTMLPKTTVKLEGKEAQQMLKLMEMLEDLDDVQNVYANFDIPDEVLQAAA